MYETAHDILSHTYDRVSAQDMCSQEHPRRLAEREAYRKRPMFSDYWYGFCSSGRQYDIIIEFQVVVRQERTILWKFVYGLGAHRLLPCLPQEGAHTPKAWKHTRITGAMQR